MERHPMLMNGKHYYYCGNDHFTIKKYRFNSIPSKIPLPIFGHRNINSKIYMVTQKPKDSQSNHKQKEQCGR